MPTVGDAFSEPLAYVIDGREMVRLNRQLSRTSGATRFLPILGTVPGIFAAGIALKNAHHYDPAFLIAGAVVIGAAVFFAIYALKSSRPPKRFSIQLNPDAIDLIVEGRAERVRWYAVSEAFDLPNTIAIKRRDDEKNPIFIPKRVLPDRGVSLWSFLEERLTGSLPGIRALGFEAPARFKNTIDQFLADRSAPLEPSI